MPIQILSSHLVNQIAAGEMVERPASVVKELIENSLDAGATQINIDIENAGVKMIRIRDNGCGIKKEELKLALFSYATSKIASLEDLQSITSMGFRGEALANISAISRLILTSRSSEQKEAWQAYSEGRDISLNIIPVAHPIGTTVEVLDLFYNTPARRKFIKTEKTEFSHIKELIRGMALSRFDVTFILTHNGKIIGKYRSITEKNHSKLKRLINLCGIKFVERSIEISYKNGELTIFGWITVTDLYDNLKEIEYSYVNHRMIRDRIILHAVRQAYNNQLSNNSKPYFVLFLGINPNKIDINVHPSKKEIRFHQSRLVHDFIYQSIIYSLKKGYVSTFSTKKEEENNLIISSKNIMNKKDKTVKIHSSLITDNSTKYLFQQCKEKIISKDENNYPIVLKQPISYKRSKLSLLNKDPYNKYLYYNKDKNDDKKIDLNNFGRILTLFYPYYALMESSKLGLTLLSLSVAERCFMEFQLSAIPAHCDNYLQSPLLLIPLRIILDEQEIISLNMHQNLLQQFGICLQQTNQNQGILHAIPFFLQKKNIKNFIPNLLKYLYHECEKSITKNKVATWISTYFSSDSTSWNRSSAIQLINNIEKYYPQWVENPPYKFLFTFDLESAIKELNSD